MQGPSDRRDTREKSPALHPSTTGPGRRTLAGRRGLVVLVATLVVGAALRSAYLAEIMRSPTFSFPMIDPLFSDYWARGMVTGHWSSPLIEEAYGRLPDIAAQPYFRPPGYPFFLALVYHAFGLSYVAARVAQMVLGIASAALAFAMGRRILGRTTGFIVAALMSTYWAFIYFEGELMEPALFIFLVLAASLLLLRTAVRPSFSVALAAGIITGLAATVRTNVLAFVPVALAWGFWIWRRRGATRRFLAPAVGLVLGIIAAVSPVTIRNHAVSGEFVPISANLGVNLYIGNNDRATGTFIGDAATLSRFGSCFDYPRIVSDLERESGRKLTYSEVSSYYAGKAVAFIRGNPGAFWRLTLRKAYLFLGPHEITLDKVIQEDRRRSPTLSAVPGNFPLVLALALVGTALLAWDLRRGAAGNSGAGADDEPIAAPQRAREGSVLLWLFVLSYAASFLPFFVTAGYRVPIVPFLLLFAAYALCRMWALARRRAFRAAGLSIAATALLYGIAQCPFVSYEPELDKWHLDRGVAYAFGGDRDAAIREYTLAIGASERPPAYLFNNLGAALATVGRMDEAITSFERAIEIDPGLAVAQCGLADALASRGDDEEAVRHYRAALEADPSSARTHCNFGAFLLRLGDERGAADHFARALEANPRDARSMNNMAWLLATGAEADLRDGAKAVTLAEEAMSLGGGVDPGFLDTLAAAYAEAGRFAEAVATAQRALSLAGEERALAEGIAARLALYRQGRPYRETPPIDKGSRRR